MRQKRLLVFVFSLGFLASLFYFSATHLRATDAEYKLYPRTEAYYEFDPSLAGKDYIQARIIGTCADVCRDLGMNARPECGEVPYDGRCRITRSSSGGVASSNSDCLETDALSRGMVGRIGSTDCCCGGIYDPSQYKNDCKENDAGADYFKKSAVLHNLSGIRNDICFGSQLKEYYCEDGLVKSEFYNCPAGCLDGQCLSDDQSEVLRIKNVRVSSVTNDSASLRFETEEKYTCNIEYAETSQGEPKLVPALLVQTGTPQNYYQYIYTYKLFDLQAMTDYLLQIKCRDAQGQLHKNEPLIFTTADAMQDLIFSQIEVTYTTASSVLFSWQTNQDTVDNEVLIRDKTASKEWTTAAADTSARKAHEVLVTGINPDSEYAFRISSTLVGKEKAWADESESPLPANPQATVALAPAPAPDQLSVRPASTSPAVPSLAAPVQKIVDQKLLRNIKGKIIIKPEDQGKAYYVDPKNDEAYFLGRPEDAFRVMRERGIGISNENLAKIPLSSTTANASAFAQAQLGKIFLQVEANGEAWYVNPTDAKRYFLGRPQDAFALMRKLGLGISNQNFMTAVGGTAVVAEEVVAPVQRSGLWGEESLGSPDKDTDQDGLNDFEEKAIYNTDPNNKDSDGDGYSDGDEVRQWYNPAGAGKLAEPLSTAHGAIFNHTMYFFRTGDAARNREKTVASEEFLQAEFGLSRQEFIDLAIVMIPLYNTMRGVDMVNFTKMEKLSDHKIRLDYTIKGKDGLWHGNDMAIMEKVGDEWWINLEDEINYYKNNKNYSYEFLKETYTRYNYDLFVKNAQEGAIGKTPMDKTDTDGDGLLDQEEIWHGTDPRNPDSDGDGHLDGAEVRGGYNPLGVGYIKSEANTPEGALSALALAQYNCDQTIFQTDIDKTFRFEAINAKAKKDLLEYQDFVGDIGLDRKLLGDVFEKQTHDHELERVEVLSKEYLDHDTVWLDYRVHYKNEGNPAPLFRYKSLILSWVDKQWRIDVSAMLDFEYHNNSDLAYQQKNSRDTKRLGDIKQIQTANELYFSEEGRYAPSIVPGESFGKYMSSVPKNPTPYGENCADFGEYKYTVTADGQSYQLEYCLESRIGQIPAGVNRADSRGLTSESGRALSNAKSKTCEI